MKTVIWKFALSITTQQEIEMPRLARPLSVAMQGEQLCLWARCQPGQPRGEYRTVVILGTGHEVETRYLRGLDFLGTVQAGAFVWHVFVEPAP